MKEFNKYGKIPLVNIKMTVQYEGTAYSGWQVQRRKSGGKGSRNIQTRKTVQGEIEKQLKRIFQKDVKITGASRTDAGVHASGQTANFLVKDDKVSLKVLQHSLNSMLPKDIVISKMAKAEKSFNARYAARSKIYEYRILNQQYPEVLDRNFYWHIWQELDWRKVVKSAGYLQGRSDFSAFSSTGSPRNNNFCNLKRLDIIKKGSLYRVVIEADFFLYRMARNIVGLLVHVGKGKVGPKWAETVLKKGKIDKEYKTAPAKGLCLMKVKYK